MDEVTLSSLAEGEKGIVKSLGAECGIRSRLRSLGLAEGSDVECLHRSFSGSISAYLICGAVIAIRSGDCEGIIVTKKGCGL